MAHRYVDPYSGKSKSLRHSHMKKGKKKLQNLYNIGGDSWYPWPVCWSDYEFDRSTSPYGWPAENAYLKRNYRRPLSKWLKQQSHRKARRKEITNSTYNKVYDYWWELD